MAQDLIEAAGPRAGERVLDVACGTGVVTRLAADRVGPSGVVVGLDVTPAMLEVARASTPSVVPISWYEASAVAMALPDASFDVVLCQMGLQFMSNRAAALREMRRMLDREGHLYLNVPGLKPVLLGVMTEAFARHVGPRVTAFSNVVFSLHNGDDITQLLRDAGFREVHVRARPKSLRLPLSADFLWQYLYSTSLAEPVSKVGAERRPALEQEVCGRWQAVVTDGALPLEVRMVTAAAHK